MPDTVKKIYATEPYGRRSKGSPAIFFLVGILLLAFLVTISLVLLVAAKTNELTSF